MNLRQFIKNQINYLLTENKNFTLISLQKAISISSKSDIKDVSEWLRKTPEEIEFYFTQEPLSDFENQILEMESTYDEFPKDEQRTKNIYELLKGGYKPKPIFVEYNDSNKFIMEGRHRVVAFKWFGLKQIPVLYVK
jgi:hypothetical protein